MGKFLSVLLAFLRPNAVKVARQVADAFVGYWLLKKGTWSRLF
jgi:hypothetical protein